MKKQTSSPRCTGDEVDEEKLRYFMVRKMFIEIRLCNPITYDFKGHVKVVEIYIVKFNVSILNRLKIMDFFVCKLYT